MNGFIRFFILSALIASITSCASTPVEEDLSLEGSEVTEATPPAKEGQESNAISDFENSEVDKKAQAEKPAPSTDEDLDIEQELKQAEGPKPPVEKTAPAETVPPVEQAPKETAQTPPEQTTPAAPPAEIPAPTVDEQLAETPPAEAPAPVQIPEPAVPSPTVTETAPVVTPKPETQLTTIKDLKFKANEAGGTIVVEADKPLSYTTRSNPDLNQFIVEVENAKLPTRLKRSLNTRDIQGSVGAIDAYQNPGSTTARFVIQLREGVAEPAVQAEGNSLLIVANAAATKQAPAVAATGTSAEEETATATTGATEKILPSKDLSEFLAGNTKFYGKKISIETKSMDIRDALSFITEESGVNMVVSDDVKGSISLKLRQVPWDQALVVIMKARKLGYTRQGNVLRIAPLEDLKAEEDDANKVAISRRNVEPLKVRMFPLSYAKVDELEKKMKDFLGERGKVVGDTRINALVVTDIEDNLERAAKLIASLDTQPPQVSIEGKIVEAKETFIRNIGVNWGASGAPIKLGSTKRGPVNMNPSFNINPTAANTVGNLNFNLSVGTLDIFGTLQAALTLQESEEQVKVISSPRIMAISNEKADITQTTEVAVRTVTKSTTGDTETFSFKPLTMKLEVTPQVTADGSVIMKVSVNRQFQGADTSGAGQGAFAVNSREANTRVLVKNGETAVIGGIYQSDATDGETGIPWFRELPIISYLFKTKNIRKDKSELLIFLTPRIVGHINSNGETAPVKEL
ncbi:MAG: type IV pilus secretin PilQ [Bdellovibrio sp.]